MLSYNANNELYLSVFERILNLDTCFKTKILSIRFIKFLASIFENTETLKPQYIDTGVSSLNPLYK